MNQDLQRIIAAHVDTGSPISKKDKEKICRYIPVPTDYEILWADIISFGGHPSGVVITDRALIIKSPHRDVKRYNKEIKRKNKTVEKEERQTKVPYLYQIIPWDYYYPEEYKVQAIEHFQGLSVYSIIAHNKEIIRFQSKGLYEILSQYRKVTVDNTMIRDAAEAIAVSAQSTLGAESTMFSATYGAANSRTGHGIYAEEAGAMLDRLNGERSTVVGRDNAKNGPDKIVGESGQPVQCKYYKTAADSVNACFEKGNDGITRFRYGKDLEGNPMKIEVPMDQYADAIKEMESHIKQGDVEGVTNPEQAKEIIRKGRITYQQAVNLAKAGTIESLTYDVGKAAVNCLSVFGVSAVVTFALIYWKERDLKKAAKGAIVCSAQIYGLSVTASVLSAQLSRTRIMGMLENAFSKLIQRLPTKFTNSIANSFRLYSGKPLLTGAEAQTSFAKFLSANTITIAAIALVFSLPDTYRVVRGYISTAQYVKNISTLLASVTGSVAASAGAGAAVGTAAGPFGTVIGFAAGMAGGFVAGGAARLVGNVIIEDDSVLFGRMFNAILMNKAMDYMLSEDEVKRVIELLNEDKKGLKKLQRSFIKSTHQATDISNYLNPLIKRAIEGRKKIRKRVESRQEKKVGKRIFKEGAYEM